MNRIAFDQLFRSGLCRGDIPFADDDIVPSVVRELRQIGPGRRGEDADRNAGLLAPLRAEIGHDTPQSGVAKDDDIWRHWVFGVTR